MLNLSNYSLSTSVNIEQTSDYGIRHSINGVLVFRVPR